MTTRTEYPNPADCNVPTEDVAQDYAETQEEIIWMQEYLALLQRAPKGFEPVLPFTGLIAQQIKERQELAEYLRGVLEHRKAVLQ